MERGIYITQTKCLDCGAKLSPGYDYCFSCGSKFENQKGRTKKEQQVFTKKIKKNQRIKRKEFRQRNFEKWKEEKKEEVKEEVHSWIPYIATFLIISIVTGFIGFFVGLINFNEGGWGFLIGFLAPLILLFLCYEYCD